MAYAMTAHAKDCSVSIYKTYVPRGEGKPACDEQNLPAEFAGDLTILMGSLNQLGYTTSRFDQCSATQNPDTTYALVSQLGDCVQSGPSITCKLYAAIYENKNHTVVYENYIAGTGLLSVRLHLSEVLQKLPACSDL